MLQHHIPFSTVFPSCLSNFISPYFISFPMKFQVVISKSRIFETFLYCVVTSYSLSIEKCLFDKHFVASTNYTDFYWYSKCGGGNSGLKFIFRIKYDKGHILSPSLMPLDINSKLVYAYGSSTPFMSLSPLKELKSS